MRPKLISSFLSAKKLVPLMAVTSLSSPLALFAASNQYRLSTISSGDFQRQIEIPESEQLSPNTPLMEKALEEYGHTPFDIGERIRFAITYLGVKGGTAELLLRTPIKWKNGKNAWAHRITGEVKSAEWVSWFTVLHDSIECITEGNRDFLPLRFYINQNEGSFHQTKIVSFFRDEKKVRQVTQRKGREEKKEEFPFDRAQDAVGSLYYLRDRLARGDFKTSFEFPIFTSEKTWTGTGKLLRSEQKKVEGIKYDTDVWELSTHFGSSLEQKGKIRMWFTRDARKLPVYIEAEVMFGAVKLALVEWDQGYPDPKKKQLYDKIRAED